MVFESSVAPLASLCSATPKDDISPKHYQPQESATIKSMNITIWLHYLQPTNASNVTVQLSELLPCIQVLLGSHKRMHASFCIQLNCVVLWH